MHAVTTMDADSWVSVEYESVWTDHTAADAVTARLARLRNAHTDVSVTGNMITYRLNFGPLGPSTTVLTFVDVP